MPPRLVRRRTLNERIRTYFNPWDFLLWLSEELESNDWDQWHETWATPIGLTLNIVFLIARANSGPSLRNQEDDVFGDIEGSSGWLVWFVGNRKLNYYLEHLLKDIGNLCHSFPGRILVYECLLYLLSNASL